MADERAAEMLEAFEERFGAPHVAFALHSAVPIALTPDLAYRILATFRVDERGSPLLIPWIAVADLLLSPLVNEAASELYTMAPPLRRHLLDRLRADLTLGPGRLREVGEFLRRIGESESRDRSSRAVAVRGEAQLWTAMSLIEPARAAASIGRAMSATAVEDQAGWIRFEALLEHIGDASPEHEVLRSLAVGMAERARGRSDALEEHVERHGDTVAADGREIARVPEGALGPRGPAVAPQKRETEEDPARAAAAGSGLRVRVVGCVSSSPKHLSEEDRLTGQELGRALATRGHTLITGAAPGLEDVVASAFAAVLGVGEALRAKLTEVAIPGHEPVFHQGVRVIGPLERSVEMCDIVVRVGGDLASSAIVAAAAKSGKPVVELPWTGGESEKAFRARGVAGSTSGPDKPPRMSSLRVREMLDCRRDGIVSIERAIARAMAAVELAIPENGRLFEEYSAAVLTALAGDLGEISGPGISTYRAALGQDAGTQGLLTREQALQLVDRFGVRFPEWLWYDWYRLAEHTPLASEGDLPGWSSLAQWCRAQLADEVAHALEPTRHGLTPLLGYMILCARSVMSSTSGQSGEGRAAYFEWLRGIFVRWAAIPLRGRSEESDRAPAIADAMEQVVGEGLPEGVIRGLLLSTEPADRMAGYLWFLGGKSTRPSVADWAALPAMEGALAAEIQSTASFADESPPKRVAWSFLWLARALLSMAEWTTDRPTEPALALAIRPLGEDARLILAVLLRLCWWLREQSQHDLQGDIQGLITRALGGLLSRDCRPWISKNRRAGYRVCLIEHIGPAGRSLGTGFLVGPRLVLTARHVVRHGSEEEPGEAHAMFLRWEDEPFLPEARRMRLSPHLVFEDAELDFALVEAQETPGQEPVAGALRGWFTLPPQDTLDVGERLYVVGTMEARPITAAPGNVVGQDMEHIRYGAITGRGYSGSPVIQESGDIVGMHYHRADNGIRSAIRATAIVARLRAAGRFDLLDGNAPPPPFVPVPIDAPPVAVDAFAAPPYFDADLIADLHRAAVEAGLGGMRDALFNGVARPYVASFTQIPGPGAQILVDLGRLNGDKPLRDGSVPFRQWLRNARSLTREQNQERVFERAILALDSRLAGPLGKEAVDVSRALSSWSSKEIEALVAQRLGTRPAEDDSLDLVSSATRGNWLDLVIAAALSSRLGDVGLVKLAGERGLVPSVPIKTRALEEIVRTKTFFQDVAVWRARLARWEPCVARVEILEDTGVWKAKGTAFLVGPDRVMTNHHVVRSLLGPPEETHNRLRFRFDYKRITDGTELLAGRVVMADEEWELLSRRPSPTDEAPPPGDPEPGDEELDFALIQLAEPVGEQPVSAAPGATSGALRGWLDATVDPALTALSEGDDVFLLQHPEGDSLQIAAGRLLAIRKQRIRYDANTLPGSSGSPCFDAKLNLVALHHLGDPSHDPAHRPEYNQGIPMHRIVACCAKEGLPFEPPPAHKP